MAKRTSKGTSKSSKVNGRQYPKWQYVAAGAGAVVLTYGAYWLVTKAFRKDPTTRAGLAFNQALRDRGIVSAKSDNPKMLTVDQQSAVEREPFFGGWYTQISDPPIGTRELAAQLASKHGVRLIHNVVFGTPPTETFLFLH